MSHHVYTTLGVVLSSYPTKEADKTLSILTKDLGLIFASVRGVRKSNSKLSSMFEDMNLVKVSLVKGKRQWRLTTAEVLETRATRLRDRRETLKALLRVHKLLSRLVRGEEKNETLFETLESSTKFLLDNELTQEEISNWEVLSVARLLSLLGYLSEDLLPKDIAEVAKSKKDIVKLINEGLHASGLS